MARTTTSRMGQQRSDGRPRRVAALRFKDDARRVGALGPEFAEMRVVSAGTGRITLSG